MMFFMRIIFHLFWMLKLFFKTISTVLSHNSVYNDATSLSDEEMKKVERMRNNNG